MDDGVDTGDIAAQVAVPLPDGIAWGAVEERCAEAGAALLVSVLAALEEGRAVRQPQLGTATTQPIPARDDFAISIEWTAQRAFNFMRGTAAWGMPYRLEGAEKQLLLYRAVDWLAVESEPGRIKEVGDRLHIGLAEGVLVAQ
jgi:methionyl-tRNA formyltransferase